MKTRMLEKAARGGHGVRLSGLRVNCLKVLVYLYEHTPD
jgi:hypothetical protein